LATLVLAAGVALPALAQSPPAYVYSSPLLPLLLQTPQNGWIRVNANLYSDVWTPDELEPLFDNSTRPPSKIILAWSGFAWDSNRGDLILYGGGHANYSGNDVYRWRSSTLQWERAALPSEIRNDPVSGYQAIDGVDNAPSSAHTYDNNIFLPIVDRFLTWGGAAYTNGGPYYRVSETDPSQKRITGPYLFDPSKANGNKVGGTTGSHVKRVAPHPEVVGGQMWQNRDMPKNLAGQTMPGSHVDGCTGYASEGGHDVVYVGASNLQSTSLELYRYQITDVTNPAQDQISKVGIYWNGTSGTTTCAYDPARKLFVRTGTNAIPFLFWDVTSPGPSNIDHRVTVGSTIAAFQSWLTAQSFDIQNCALDFDPVRQSYPLWCGGPTVWDLKAPPGGNTDAGWTIAQRPNPITSAPPTSVNALSILGKWRYVPYYDVFVALEDIDNGNVWIYKPQGWVQPNPPGNALPTVNVTSPTAGASFAPRGSVALQANAFDSNGSIARVEYYVNGVKVGQATTAPYTVTINPVLIGNYTVVAVAVDNVGGMRASAGVTFSVSATLTTTVLQRGLNGYAGATDTFLDNFGPTTVRGSFEPLYLDPTSYSPLVRFSIFQSEGGPVPSGAVIQSATLSLYKQYYADDLAVNALRKPWVESQATWNLSQTGVPWTVAGALGAGTDYTSTADDVITPSYNPGWVNFDVAARVQQWGDTGGNYGWKLSQTTGGTSAKTFNSSEYATASLRPKLTIVWSAGGTANQPPTVSLTSPANSASITLGQSFTVTATASDDVGVTQVEFFAGSTSLGKVMSAPYTLSWTPAATGPYTLTAVATDTASATKISAPVAVTVNPVSSGTTVVLQRGLNGYAGATDTFLDNYLRTTVRGSFDPLYIDATNYTPLVRFAIYASEGGPVPNGATIQSATLALYKQYYDVTVRLNALLKPWVESQATWTLSQAGVAWTSGGAAASGSDYNAAADALVAGGYNPGWMSFDVTSRVAQWGSGANYGWRLAQTSLGSNAKTFVSSANNTNTTLRPKLTVVYSGGATGNQPPTVSLTSPANNASITLGQSFTVTASAGDDVGVTHVEFFAGSTSLGKVASPALHDQLDARGDRTVHADGSGDRHGVGHHHVGARVGERQSGRKHDRRAATRL
jgi:hypothetical protein